MTYQSTKTYGHEQGFSCAFRQWRAAGHCSKNHGYSLGFKFVFEGELDDKNWVCDFGDLKELKEQLKESFDHRTLVSVDDPHINWFFEAHALGIIDILVLESVGCEMFAKYAYDLAHNIISKKYEGRVRVVSCEVAEHGANSAIYLGAK